MIRFGTSGFSYDDWPGLFYPPRTPARKMFEAYCAWFGAVEINATFYGSFAPATTRSILRRAAGRVTFAAKMVEDITHKGDLGAATVARYARGMDPIADAGKLGAILFQFPFRFHCTRENRAYLARALAAFPAYPPVVEIRHDSWQGEEGMAFFRDRGISLCVLDMPQKSRLPRTRLDVTGPIAYARFHGRNGTHWFKDSYPGAPYDYNYTDEELREWVRPLLGLERKAQTTFAFFNNHVRAQAPLNAITLRGMLEERSPEETRGGLATAL